jgi:hypothetical protein
MWTQTAPAAGGPLRVTLAAGQEVAGRNFGAHSDDTSAPEVRSASFDHDAAPPRVRLVMSEAVGGTLAPGDLRVENVETGAAVDASLIAVTYDRATHTATFTFPGYPGGRVPDGNYRAVLTAGSIADEAGNPLAADYTFDFFVLAGDINRDRRVDGTDFAILAGNFGKTGMTYDKGDLNGDGAVNGSDFALLAGNFGRSVPAPQASSTVVAAPLETAAARSARRAVAKAAVTKLIRRRPRPGDESAGDFGRARR